VLVEVDAFDPLDPLGRVDRLYLNLLKNLDIYLVTGWVKLQSHLSRVLQVDVELQQPTTFNASH
jgi:hypothetical protein